MREIKFRGQTITREWVYGSLYIGELDGQEYAVIMNNKTTSVAKDLPNRIAIAFDREDVHIVYPATVGQYWRTINGKKLFDGDIFRFKVGDEYIIRMVRYSEEQAVFCIINPSQLKNEKWMQIEQIPNSLWWQKFVNDIEIIGNIHDNPELLRTE